MDTPQKPRLVMSLKQETSKIYFNILRLYLSTTTLPNKDALLGAVRARNVRYLLGWAESVDPQMYDSPANYFAAAQLVTMVKKYPFPKELASWLNPEATAILGFQAAEERCKEVNLQRTERRRKKSFNQYECFAHTARRYIQRVLGDTPDLAKIYDLCDFSQGASVGVHGNKTNLMRKVFAESWSVSPSCLVHATHALWRNFHLRTLILDTHESGYTCHDPRAFAQKVVGRAKRTRYNKITFVPKTAKTHRAIAVEPMLNGFVQKGVDQFMRQRLLRVGIDLSDQSKNRRYARIGSLGGHNPYVTIDLSAASDTISIETVRQLLPPQWFDFLSEIRSTHYSINGADELAYEKFCSMGNGFCFPLETLIFSSLCYAVLDHCGADRYDFCTYGDDIIIRQSYALLLIEVLSEAGFTVNKEKSFITGPFRESCGADWHGGQDVRPVVYDEAVTDNRSAMALHNSFLRSKICEEASLPIREYLRSVSSSPWMRPGREPGDTCFSVPMDVAMSSPTVWWDRLNQALRWREFRVSPVQDKALLGAAEYGNILLTAVLRGSDSRKPFSLRYTYTVRNVTISRPHRNEWHGELETLREKLTADWSPILLAGI